MRQDQEKVCVRDALIKDGAESEAKYGEMKVYMTKSPTGRGKVKMERFFSQDGSGLCLQQKPRIYTATFLEALFVGES